MNTQERMLAAQKFFGGQTGWIVTRGWDAQERIERAHPGLLPSGSVFRAAGESVLVLRDHEFDRLFDEVARVYTLKVLGEFDRAATDTDGCPLVSATTVREHEDLVVEHLRDGAEVVTVDGVTYIVVQTEAARWFLVPPGGGTP